MIRILTDSTSDIPQQDAEKLGVTVIPLQINFGDKSYRDGIDLSIGEFLEKLDSSKDLPTTSQPSLELFIEQFSAAKQKGDTLICILMSSALSGTFQCAKIAKQEVGYEKIYIIDSKSATLANYLLVERAVSMVKQGFSASEIVAYLENAKEYLYMFAVISDLRNLHKGGRLSATSTVVGGILGIKPIVTIAKEGNIQLVGKARGLSNSNQTLLNMIEKAGGISEKWPIMVGYTGDRKSVTSFAQLVTGNLQRQIPKLRSIGAVIATHAGTGGYGIAFLGNTRRS